MNTRKPFGLRSDYVQITFNYVQVAQILRNNYVKFQGFFELFWVLSKIFKNLGNPTKIVSKEGTQQKNLDLNGFGVLHMPTHYTLYRISVV